MSRPNISYPTPVPGPSSYSVPPVRGNMGLDPSPLSREAVPGQTIPGQAPGPGIIPPRRQPSGSTASRSGYTSALDSSITRLLVTTKQLLQGLEQWSQRVISENDVSDIYVRLGNGFEVCIQAFQRAGIPTAELDSIPNDLRACLEQCLSYEQNHEALEVYLPEIRQIIYNLLHGLKQKQAAYKRLVQNRERETPPPQLSTQPTLAPAAEVAPPAVQSDQSRRPSRSEESRLSARSGTSATSSTSPASVNSQLPTTKAPSSSALAERSGARTGLPSRPAPPDAFRPPRARAPDSRQTSSSSNAPHEVVRHQLTDNPVPVPTPSQPPPSIPTISVPNNKPTPPRPDRFSRDSYGSIRPVSRFSADSDITNGSPIRSPPSRSPQKPAETLPETAEENEEVEGSEAKNEPEPMTIPPSLPILNLPAAIPIPDGPPAPPIEALPDVPPETRATLAALQRSDALERRASKRFSSYTFNKMLPGSPGKKASIGSPQRPTRRADRPPPLPAFPEGLTSAPLIPSPGEDIPPVPVMHLQANGHDQPKPKISVDDRPSSPLSNRSNSPLPSDRSDGSVRVVRTPEPGESSTLPMSAHATPRPRSSVSGPATVSVFLQIGRQVKKANLELPVAFSNLRLLFMERFEYDPGMEDFPDVYIRDNRTGVQFELEDMEDLKDGCILSLNIEPLDQVKQHFDTTFATLMQEIKEMKKAMDVSRRMSMTPSSSLLAVSPSAPQMSRRNTFVKPPSETATSPSPAPRSLSPTGKDKDPRGPPNPDREKELQGQYEELQSLRRDLAVMRQIHVDFLSDTKESFTKLRTQNEAMREVVKTKMGGSRALLDNSKAKLEARCQDTIQAVEEISDTIDAAREDAYRRFVTPSKNQMANIKSDLEKAKRFVAEFASDVQLADPTWRATWQTELHRVMEEQKLLSYQLKLCSDLKNDIKDAEDMLRNVQDFVNQRAAGVVRTPGSKSFRSSPAPGEADPPNGGGEEGLPHLLMEIRTKETDPNQRLKAIEAQQRAREKEKANKVDEFEDELAKFVGGRKLKKTGGTEEAERQRLRRQEQTLRRMMNGGDPAASAGSGGAGGVLSPQNTGASLGGGGRAISPQLTGGSTATQGKVLTPNMTGGSGTRLTPNLTGGSVKQEPTAIEIKQEPE
ncbi:hypothetical protein CI109_106806 [Kwoniella shandongensis]|uniref:Uncharacterized protein n=1 Tax=Kwoniella shandongensis TaxID=1734106 RepID=A0A5M6C6K2_9TREE|nr:uncharacterized protein CI109_000937 [Kwoniella shandongensis]KAA5530757.1 hypothetical protein CI109_000937 [Kwoniella shandongensis]